MSRRPHPAHRARTITGAGSVAVLAVMTGYLASSAHGSSATTASASTIAPSAGPRGLTTSTTIATTTTVIEAATPVAPAAVAQTRSGGS